MRVFCIILALLIILSIKSNEKLYGGNLLCNELTPVLYGLKFYRTMSLNLEKVLLNYCLLLLLPKIKTLIGNEIDISQLNRANLVFFKNTINGISSFFDFLNKLNQSNNIYKLIGGNIQQLEECDALEHLDINKFPTQKNYIAIAKKNFPLVKADILRRIKQIEDFNTEPGGNETFMFKIAYLRLVIPYAETSSDLRNRKIKILKNNKYIDYLYYDGNGTSGQLYAIYKPEFHTKEFKETIIGNKWPHQSPKDPNVYPGSQQPLRYPHGLILYFRFSKLSPFMKTIHDLSCIHFSRDVQTVANVGIEPRHRSGRGFKKQWFFDRAIFPAFTNSAWHNYTGISLASVTSGSFAPTIRTGGTVKQYWPKWGYTGSVHESGIAACKAGHHDQLACNDDLVIYQKPHIIQGVKKYFIEYFSTFGTGYTNLKDGKISDLLENHMNNSDYNETMPPPPPVKVNGMINYVEEKPVYFAKVSKKIHNGLTLYKIESKYKNTTNPYHNTELYSSWKIKSGVPQDKDYIIGKYQREGLNYNPTGNKLTGFDFILDPDGWYNFENTDDKLTVREFKDQIIDRGKLNVLDLIYSEENPDNYSLNLKNYLLSTIPHPFYPQFYINFLIKSSWRSFDTANYPPRGYWGYVRIRTKFNIKRVSPTRITTHPNGYKNYVSFMSNYTSNPEISNNVYLRDSSSYYGNFNDAPSSYVWRMSFDNTDKVFYITQTITNDSFDRRFGGRPQPFILKEVETTSDGIVYYNIIHKSLNKAYALYNPWETSPNDVNLKIDREDEITENITDEHKKFTFEVISPGSSIKVKTKWAGRYKK